ncbi:MAG: hypothetical protein NTX64_16215 [Elusimicrobia bacterium]|nr:hypothetical protein [Elusimicrobiota bacterium]
MLDRQPSALTPLGIIVAAFGLFFLSPGREADVRVRWPAVVPARATAPSSYHQALRRALQARPAPRILPPDARDAVAGLADWEPRGRAAQPGARLVAGKGDWRSSFWNDRFVEISAARREPDGRVTRSRAPAQAASLPLPHRGEGRVNAEQKQRLPSPRPLPNGGKGNAGSRQTPGRSHAAHRDPRSEETAKDRAALEQVEEEERWTFDEPDGPLPPQGFA